jgi:hypothetical protein
MKNKIDDEFIRVFHETKARINALTEDYEAMRETLMQRGSGNSKTYVWLVQNRSRSVFDLKKATCVLGKNQLKPFISKTHYKQVSVQRKK